MKQKNVGFTLLEIMLVLVLISLSSIAVIVNSPSTKQDLAKEQAQRFFYRLQLLNEQAILSGKDFGIRLNDGDGSYTYLTLTEDGWQIFENKIYSETEFGEGIKASLELGSNAWSNNESLFSQESFFDEEMFSEYDDEEQVKPPQVFILSSGEMTPFQLSIFLEENVDNTWVVDVEESGVIKLLIANEHE